MDRNAELLKLRDDRVFAVKQAENIKDKADRENRPMTDDEEADVRGLVQEAKRLLDRIETLQEQTALIEEIDAQAASLAAPTQRQAVTAGGGGELPDGRQVRQVVAPVSARSQLKAFRGRDARENAYKCGRWLQAVILGDGPAANWCYEHGMVLPHDRRNTHTEGVNSAGGFLVPEEFARTIIDLREQYGVFRRNTKIMPMSSDSLSMSRRAGGITAAWAGEGSIAAESTKSWNQVNLSAQKLSAFSKISEELAEDAIIDVADDIAQEMAYDFSIKEDEAGFNGDGTSTYGGIEGITTILEANTSYVGSIAATSGDDQFSELTLDDYVKMIGLLPKYAKQRGQVKWYISDFGWAMSMLRLTVAGGGNAIADLEAGSRGPQFLGYPVETTESLPTDDTAQNGAVMVLLGALELSSTLGQRTGMRVSRTDQRYWDTDEIGIKARERVDIVNHDLGSASAAGPVVGLLGTT